jgi:hypothetical protein
MAGFDETNGEKELLKWTGPSRPFYAQSRHFFSTAAVIVTLVGLILILASEWMLIIMLTAGAFAYYVWTTVPPEETTYTVTVKGIRVHSRLYRWSELSQWWIEEKWGNRLLGFELVAGWPKRIYLVLKEVDLNALAETLNQYLVLEKPEPTSMDKFSHWIEEKFPLDVK